MSLLDTASLVITPNGTKASTLYSVVPSDGSGDMTVTRATTATRVNSAGLIESVASNVPRLDYSNGTCPSILVEPQRTNLILYSQDFSSNWNKTNVTTTPNSGTSPLGSNTATKYTCTANGAYIFQSVSSQNVFTISCFAKKVNSDWIWLGYNIGGVGDFGASFNINTGSLGTIIGTGITYSIEDYSNGWFRCVVTKDFAGASPLCVVVPLSGNNDFSNQSGKEYLIWGYQGEAGSYATSYIPTTSASVTRNADVISKTGISSLIGQTEGTLLVDFYYDGVSSNYVLMQLFDSATPFNFIQYYLDNSKKISFEVGGTGAITDSNVLATGRNKIAGAYKNNDFVLYINGTQIGTDTSGSVIATNSITLNDFYALPNAYKKVMDINLTALWKTRLTNTQLAQLTTI